MLSTHGVASQVSRQLLFFLYGSGLVFHLLQFAGGYLPTGCVIKLLIRSVGAQE